MLLTPLLPWFGRLLALVVFIPVALFHLPTARAQYALQFDGVDDYVEAEFDRQLSTITVEGWFRPASPWEPDSAHKALWAWRQDDGSLGHSMVIFNRDGDGKIEFLLRGLLDPGVKTTTTRWTQDEWYHLAATWDGKTARLYVNGVEESSASAQGDPQPTRFFRAGGFASFADVTIDEIRVWSYARSPEQVRNYQHSAIVADDRLALRWDFNEGKGTTVRNSCRDSRPGVVVGATWVEGKALGAPNRTPMIQLVGPSRGATEIAVSAPLSVTVGDPDGGDLTVTYYGRHDPVAMEDFTLVVLPDTQHYSRGYPEIFNAQTQWILDTKDDLRTVFVSHVGDIVQHGYDHAEWNVASRALGKLEGVIPYGLAPGNHDSDEDDDPDGWYGTYNEYFPVSRFAHFPWYGGNYHQNQNSYQLFSVDGLDFLTLHLEGDAPDNVLAWANIVLAAHPDRRAIVTTHIYVGPSKRGPGRATAPYYREGGNSGEEIWQELIKDNCQVFLVLSGHYARENRLTSTNSCGQPVYQILQDYQEDPNGGNGWLRYYTFRPTQHRVDAYTYSPYLEEYSTSNSSQFSFAYAMTPRFKEIGQVSVASGSKVGLEWDGLAAATPYEWYATVSDGLSTTASPVWHFTTRGE